MEMLVAQKKVKSNIFAAYLAPDGKSGSTLSLGGPDSSFFSGDITYIPVLKYVPNRMLDKLLPYYWVFLASDIKIAGESAASCVWPNACIMVPDTGTRILAGPKSMADPIIQQIGHVAKDCSNVDKLPTISFTLSGKDFDLGPEFYVLQYSISGKKHCKLGIEGDRDMPNWILGTPFLRKYYTVWDADQQRVGFAKAKASEFDTPSTSPIESATAAWLADDQGFGPVGAPMFTTAKALAVNPVATVEKVKQQRLATAKAMLADQAAQTLLASPSDFTPAFSLFLMASFSVGLLVCFVVRSRTRLTLIASPLLG
jgi:hypothetical protein